MSETIVIDSGSELCKIGWAEERNPKLIFPTILGRPKNQGAIIMVKNLYIGNEAYQKKRILRISKPIEKGIVTNFEDMEKLWSHIFDEEAKTTKANRPSVLLSEAPFNPRVNREKTVEFLFENINVPSAYLENHQVLALYGTGSVTGLVVDSGGSVTHTVPVYEGHSIPHAIVRFDLGGNQITDHMINALKERDSDTNWDRETVDHMKTKLFYIAQNLSEELKKSNEESYELPDGNVIHIGQERFKFPEGIFDPSILSVEGEGLHKQIQRSLGLCDTDLRDQLRKMVLCGGNTLFDGMKGRLKTELKSLSIQSEEICDRGGHLSWIGGSILASLSSFPKMAISKAEYEEFGTKIVDRKCF